MRVPVLASGVAALVALLGLSQGAAAPQTATRRAPAAAGARASRVETLQLESASGESRNHAFRRGKVAAHVVVTSGLEPRLLFAFPAGNTGVALWFAAPARPARLAFEGGLQGVELPGGRHGVSAVLSVAAPSLRTKMVVLGSVRTVRDARFLGKVPPEVAYRTTAGPPLLLSRRTIDGHRIEASFEPLEGGRASADAQGRVTLEARAGAQAIRVRVSATTDYAPLTPIPARALVTKGAADDPEALHALAFLSYREKLLAGSWRYLTYFGRDTLFSLRLLLPVLQPEVVEAGLGAVLDRVSTDGNVPREEEIGDFAVLRNLASDPRPADLTTPRYVYWDIDDDLLLAPVLARYVLDTPRGRARAAAFLARRAAGTSARFSEIVRRNLELVERLAAPFARTRRAVDLVSLRKGAANGTWRDSAECARTEGYLCNEALGRGRIPFDVNVALVPAALAAGERLYRSGLLGRDDRVAAVRLHGLALAWSGAAKHFRVEVPAQTARERLRVFAREVGVDPAPALASLRGPVVFSALALMPDGRPVPVMHTDIGFPLLFGEPPPAQLEQVATRLLSPFPAGLTTPVGVVVANPALAPDPALRALFGAGKYHGTVVWSWQQAMLAAGIAQQLRRADLPAATRRMLHDAQAALWRAIRASDAVRNQELWTFKVQGGRYRIAPFAGKGIEASETNAYQLWSTVYLAVRPPSETSGAAPPAPGSATPRTTPQP